MFKSIEGREHGIFYISSIKKDYENNTLIFYLMNGGNIKEAYGSADEMDNTYQEFMDNGLFVEVEDRVFNIIHFSTIDKADMGNDYLVHIVIRTGETIICKFDNDADRDEFYDSIVSTTFGGGGGSTPSSTGGKLVQKPTFDDFPSTGDTKCAYVAKDTDKLYYWDATNKEYVEISGGSGDAVLTEQIVSNVACGAAAANTIFKKDMSFTEFAKKILTKELAPTISTSFTGTGIKEIGTTVNGTTMKLEITNESSYTRSAYTIKEINFYVGNTKVDTKPYVSGTSVYTYTYGTAITTNTTVKAELVYNTNKTLNGSGSFTFIYGRFYGVLPGGVEPSDLDGATVKSLVGAGITKDVTNGKGFTWSNITLDDQKFFYMYPSSNGDLSSIKDGNGFEQISGYDKFIVNYEYETGKPTVAYTAYLLKDPATGTGFKQIYS